MTKLTKLNSKVQPRPKNRVKAAVEEHVSPGGRTKYTTKPGASDGTKRVALSRAREKQHKSAPRAADQRMREQYEVVKPAVSPGGFTMFQRAETPSPLKKGNPTGMMPGVFAHERQHHQMRQSKRLLDARARNAAATANIRDDGRIALGLALLRQAVTGHLAGSSDIQLRGALVNALVCLKTPDYSEYYSEGTGNNPWNELEFLEVEMKFHRERRQNAELLFKAGCCRLVTEAVKMFPDDANVALAGFELAKFLQLSEQREVAQHFYLQGMASLATHALLRPFDAWSSTDFRSAGNIFRAVSVVDSSRSWAKEINEFVESKGYDKKTGIAHATMEEIQERFGTQIEEDPEPECEDGEEPFHILPDQPCRSHFCYDWGDTSRAEEFGHNYPKLHGYSICKPAYRLMCRVLSEFVMNLFIFDVGVAETYLPADFAVQWSRRLSELFEELLTDNLAGYPVHCNVTSTTLAHCFELTLAFAENPKWRLLFRASGCFVLASRVANTAVPFSALSGSEERARWDQMRREAREVVALDDTSR